ncbi:hypothetical protein [Methanotorris formicicus]|uniref:Uncharacterized protein n=1 Tax=Methanotorris formicicus Mc-S-70 TaxID=647171 RepID=H1KYY6_9EURY|nr:hypothetical protein [Methanotorris formicicus]EHP86566.1 hypothetical protein MetfoDRAFT_1006 [Methanotorris formicicus Mc-S-70]
MKMWKDLMMVFVVFLVVLSVNAEEDEFYVYDVELNGLGGFATMNIDFKLTGEVTNLYPYPIFVTTPNKILEIQDYVICLGREDEIDYKIKSSNYDKYMWVVWDLTPKHLQIIKNPYDLNDFCYDKSLRRPKHAVEVTLNEPSAIIQFTKNITGGEISKSEMYNYGDVWSITSPIDITTLNGREGFWIPPYTTYKISIDGNFKGYLTYNDHSKNFDVGEPGVMSNIKVLSLDKLFPMAQRYGIKLDNFKLYVSGKITKNENTEMISVVIPTPIVLKGYYRLIKSADIDVWVPSYNEWVKEHDSKIMCRDVGASDDDVLNPMIDNTLSPKIGYDISIAPKLFDVPAISYTTTSSEPLEFSYVMYWKNDDH